VPNAGNLQLSSSVSAVGVVLEDLLRFCIFKPPVQTITGPSHSFGPF
jgi:hypothetical protein